MSGSKARWKRCSLQFQPNPLHRRPSRRLGLLRGLWRRRLLPLEQNRPNLHFGIRLAMPFEPAIILAAAEMLDVELRGRVIDHFTENSGAFDDRLADQRLAAAGVQQNAVELQARADFSLTVIELYHIPFADPVLARTVF